MCSPNWDSPTQGSGVCWLFWPMLGPMFPLASQEQTRFLASQPLTSAVATAWLPWTSAWLTHSFAALRSLSKCPFLRRTFSGYLAFTLLLFSYQFPPMAFLILLPASPINQAPNEQGCFTVLVTAASPIQYPAQSMGSRIIKYTVCWWLFNLWVLPRGGSTHSVHLGSRWPDGGQSRSSSPQAVQVSPMGKSPHHLQP